jgi:hypothetical protein
VNPDSGHLIRLQEGEAVPAGYEVVPPELNVAAAMVLRGQAEAMVSKRSGGKLSKWVASRRKARRKMASESRRRNRSA